MIILIQDVSKASEQTHIARRLYVKESLTFEATITFNQPLGGRCADCTVGRSKIL